MTEWHAAQAPAQRERHPQIFNSGTTVLDNNHQIDGKNHPELEAGF
jgi:hypothetical protein